MAEGEETGDAVSPVLTSSLSALLVEISQFAGFRGRVIGEHLAEDLGRTPARTDDARQQLQFLCRNGKHLRRRQPGFMPARRVPVRHPHCQRAQSVAVAYVQLLVGHAQEHRHRPLQLIWQPTVGRDSLVYRVQRGRLQLGGQHLGKAVVLLMYRNPKQS